MCKRNGKFGENRVDDKTVSWINNNGEKFDP